jgi:hypothetical protein
MVLAGPYWPNEWSGLATALGINLRLKERGSVEQESRIV